MGRGVVEARPPIEADKGTAVRTLVEEYGPRRAMFLGDDTTDLDAFRELERLREDGTLEEILRVGVKSEEGPQEIVDEADIVADGVDGVAEIFGPSWKSPKVPKARRNLTEASGRAETPQLPRRRPPVIPVTLEVRPVGPGL